ncbi:hypothetical protein EV363DRAFT_1173863, partial [Boletus edulis]
RLLSQLATSDNEFALGLRQCLEALCLISTLRLPRASPVFVKYTSTPSSTTKAFGREHLSCDPLRVRPLSILSRFPINLFMFDADVPLFETIRPRTTDMRTTTTTFFFKGTCSYT